MTFLLSAGIVVVLDQISKFYVRQNLSPGASISIIKGVFHISYVRNPGALFGILPNQYLFLVIVAFLMIGSIVLYYYLARPHNKLFSITLGLVLGGATGNLMDRLLFGRVTDFLDFRVWPVFNVADSSMVIGSLLLGLFLIVDYKKAKI